MSTNHKLNSHPVRLTVAEAAELLRPIADHGPDPEVLSKYLEAVGIRGPSVDVDAQQSFVEWGLKMSRLPAVTNLISQLIISGMTVGALSNVPAMLGGAILAGITAGYLAAREQSQVGALESLLGEDSK